MTAEAEIWPKVTSFAAFLRRAVETFAHALSGAVSPINRYDQDRKDRAPRVAAALAPFVQEGVLVEPIVAQASIFGRLPRVGYLSLS